MEEKKNKTPNDFLEFYKSYFIDYWELKYEYLKHHIDNFDIKKNDLANIKGVNTIENKEKKFLSLLKYDLHFMKFRLIETLFSFIFALENGDDPNLWFNLSFPPDSSDRSFAAYDKISALKDRAKVEEYLKTEIKVGENLVPRWKNLFFLDVEFDEMEEVIDIIEENIITLAHRFAGIFSNRDDYNAYKHSLRCYHSSFSLSIRPQGAQQYTPLGFAKDVMILLTKQEKGDDIVINTTFKAFSIEEDSIYIGELIKLLKNILNTRISHFFGETRENLYFFKESNPVLHNDYNIINFTTSKLSLNSLYIMGYNAVYNKQFERAIPLFKKVLQIKSKHYPSIFQLGFCSISLRNYDEAILYFGRYIKNNEAELLPYALYNLVLSYYKKNDLKNAEKKLIHLLKNYSDFDDALTCSSFYLLTDILLALNQYFYNKVGKNKSNYLKRIESSLKKAEVYEFRHPDTWFNFTLIKDYLGRSEESKILYEKIIRSFPDYLDAYINLARIYFNEENLERVDTLLKKAIELDEKKSNTWNAIVNLRQKQGNEEGFRIACENSLKYSENDESKKYALYNMGLYYKLKKKKFEAIEYFKKSLDIDHSLLMSLQALGETLLDLEEYDEIIEMTDDVAHKEENIAILRIRTLALSGRGEQELALKIISKLFSIVKSDDETTSFLNNTLGDIYKISENWQKAIQYYNKALVGIPNLHKVISQITIKIKECKQNIDKLE